MHNTHIGDKKGRERRKKRKRGKKGRKRGGCRGGKGDIRHDFENSRNSFFWIPFLLSPILRLGIYHMEV